MAQTSPQLGELCAALAVVTLRAGQPRPDHRRRRTAAALPGLGPVPRGTGLPAAVAPLRPGPEAAQRPAEGRARRRAAGCLGPRAGRGGRTADRCGASSTWSGCSHALPRLLRRTGAGAGREPTLEFQPGWRRDELSLADALLLARDRDLAAGYTSVGPHRADWRIGFAGLPGREALSRGQAKLTALSALLAQAEHYAARARRVAGGRAGRPGLGAGPPAPAAGAGSVCRPAAPRSSSPAPRRRPGWPTGRCQSDGSTWNMAMASLERSAATAPSRPPARSQPGSAVRLLYCAASL